MKMTCVGLLAAAGLLLGAPATAGMMTYTGTVLSAPTGSFGLLAPRLFGYGLGAFAGWFGGAILVRAWKLRTVEDDSE